MSIQAISESPLPNIPAPAPGLETGSSLFFTLPTGFTMGMLMQILPRVKAG